MEVDGGVKAPVTRLRRRMSVEQSEESKSPALNTPTKKRGGRRAAKPDLDLIDENNPDNNTTKTTTKKAPVKEIIDSIEEKPVTPSRRSTRIKSNTSIVSDIVSGIDSPRAKRAARRTSQIGSDSEAPPTPVRQTRRTRKDSISSIEKVEIQPSTKPTIQITEMILEEPESNSSKSTNSADSNEKNTSTGNVRKSPRLREKIKQNTSTNEKEITQYGNDEPTDDMKLNTSLNKSLEAPNPQEYEIKDEETADTKVPKQNRHSLMTSNLLKNLGTEAKTNNLHLNKSTSALETKRNGNKKRSRTKSWTTVTVSNDNNFYSDNEGLRKKNNDETKIPIVKVSKLNSGDGLNTSIDKDKANKSKNKENINSFVEGDISSDTSMTNGSNKSMDKKNDENSGTFLLNQSNNEKNNLNVTNKLFETEPSCDIQTVVYIEEDSDTNSGKIGIQNRHEHEDQCVPVIRHSDQLEKDISQFSMMSQKNDSIKANLSKNANIMNDSCEPMDVDETIPESSLIPETKTNNIFSSSPCILLDKSETKEKQLNKSKRKSSISLNLNKSENENKSTLILSQLKDSSSGDINSVTKSPQNKQSMMSKTTDDLNATQENDSNKRNLSLNYVTTSTPLQQKNLQKLGNINTSIIKPNNDTNNIKTKKNNSSKNNKTFDNVDNESLSEEETSQKNNNEISKNKSNFNNSLNKTKTDREDSVSENEKDKNTSNDSNDSKEVNKSLNNKSKKLTSKISNSSKKSVNKSFTSTDSDEEMESNEESQESVNLMDDEAEDAGESYESGDSQDENERQYLRENEIMEKGETLTSDDDLSDDSDYEKDSFVVSSAEEDNELLNGTEDDLSMSDNELKMTTKSKKKYDERKKKEQKNASREMYESRHKLNISNKSSSSEIGNTKRRKQQISSSESEEENEIKSKKKNHRMKLDSSHEVSLREDKNENNNSDNKRKRLSESCYDEDVINEKEITICNVSLKEIDPLTTQVQEKHKTPQKADTSIAFINTENDPNIDSELTKTQTELDPLEDSMAEEDSLSSDNENIMQNYDSILEGLNKTSNMKSKKCDISLNVNKKKEKKKNTAIIDELNLTQVKSPKKLKKKESHNTFTGNKMTKPGVERDSSPDSIDLHLLFSEDSNSSDNIQNKKNTSKTEDFIPLKRIEGKTNIRDKTDTSNQVDTFGNLDVSYNKKNKKPKPETATNTDNTNENNESFFIDTEGTTTQYNNSLNKSSSKKNKKKISLVNTDNLGLEYDKIIDKKDVSVAANKTGTNENSDSDSPMDVPFKKEKRNSKIEENLDENGKDETDFTKDTCNKSVTKTPNSEKKKKQKITESLNIKPTENETNLNISLSKTKKKKSSDVIIEDSNEKDKPEQVFDESMTKTPGSKKKKRISQTNIQEQDEEDVPIDKSLSTPSSISKKKKQLSFSPENDQIERKGDLSLNESKLKTPGSQKKKKISLKSQEIEQPGDIPESSLNISKIKTPGSQKKKKLSESEKEDINITPGSAESKETNSHSSTGQNNSLTSEGELNDSKNTKKRKRKSSHTPEETVLEDEVNTPKKLNESLVCSQKKKRKVSQNEKPITNVEPMLNENLEQSKIGKNKKLTKETESKVQNTEIKTKKRKERDDDEVNKISKVAKGNSFDTVHVPRLPTSIIKQLDDKPKQMLTAKKPKVVSTTQFSVVEAKRRRNKPSNYLEESIYINDDEPENRKQKKVLQKPKVLPFVPTVLTSASGYTTNFKVNVLPTEIKFVAQSNTVSNFKEDFLFNKNIRRHGTYELYKRKRNIKISKF